MQVFFGETEQPAKFWHILYQPRCCQSLLSHHERLVFPQGMEACCGKPSLANVQKPASRIQHVQEPTNFRHLPGCGFWHLRVLFVSAFFSPLFDDQQIFQVKPHQRSSPLPTRYILCDGAAQVSSLFVVVVQWRCWQHSPIGCDEERTAIKVAIVSDLHANVNR